VLELTQDEAFDVRDAVRKIDLRHLSKGESTSRDVHPEAEASPGLRSDDSTSPHSHNSPSVLPPYESSGGDSQRSFSTILGFSSPQRRRITGVAARFGSMSISPSVDDQSNSRADVSSPSLTRAAPSLIPSLNPSPSARQTNDFSFVVSSCIDLSH